MAVEKETSMIRLSKPEQKLLKEKYFEINSLRINKGLRSLSESEIIHKILEKTMAYAHVGKDGEIIIKTK